MPPNLARFDMYKVQIGAPSRDAAIEKLLDLAGAPKADEAGQPITEACTQ